MRSIAGLWIDHRKAVVVVANELGEKTTLITSGVQKQLRRAGDSPLKGAFESLNVPADDIRQRKFTGKLATYYDTVVEAVRNSASILIFGPGEAKGELKKRLIQNKLGKQILLMAAAGKMTDHQIVQKVRKFQQS
jgi:hypothetical protein